MVWGGWWVVFALIIFAAVPDSWHVRVSQHPHTHRQTRHLTHSPRRDTTKQCIFCYFFFLLFSLHSLRKIDERCKLQNKSEAHPSGSSRTPDGVCFDRPVFSWRHFRTSTATWLGGWVLRGLSLCRQVSICIQFVPGWFNDSVVLRFKSSSWRVLGTAFLACRFRVERKVVHCENSSAAVNHCGGFSTIVTSSSSYNFIYLILNYIHTYNIIGCLKFSSARGAEKISPQNIVWHLDIFNASYSFNRSYIVTKTIYTSSTCNICHQLKVSPTHIFPFISVLDNTIYM